MEPVSVMENLSLVSRPGLEREGSTSEIEVVDVGRLSDDRMDWGGEGGDVTKWLVIRGPCYLSLQEAVNHIWRPDGIILLTERGRALTAADVSDVLGVRVVAQVPADPSVARMVDAGLLLVHLHGLAQFRELAGLLAQHESGGQVHGTR